MSNALIKIRATCAVNLSPRRAHLRHQHARCGPFLDDAGVSGRRHETPSVSTPEPVIKCLTNWRSS
jgi:hypothetical protein